MRLLFLGDIVGRAGRTVVCDALPGLIKRYALDFVVINGENAAGGFGITESILPTFSMQAPTALRSAITLSIKRTRSSTSSVMIG